MDNVVLEEIQFALEKVRISIIPQIDGSILLVGNEADLEKAALIVSDLGYKLSWLGESNFVQITDFTKYADIYEPVQQLPTSELTERKFLEIMQNFPNLAVVKQTEGVYAVIGDSLSSVEHQLRTTGFLVTTAAYMENFFTVSLLCVQSGSKEICA